MEVVMYAEDPGAANYLAPLPSALAARGWRVSLWARGAACQVLDHLGVNHQPPPARRGGRFRWQRPPGLVVVGTAEDPDTLGLRLVEECRAAGIPSVGVVDAGMNLEYRFRGRSRDPLARAPDWLVVPDRDTAGAYLAMGFPRQRVAVCGHPHWDHLRELARAWRGEDLSRRRRLLLPGWEPGRKVVVFAAEASTGFAAHRFRRSAEYTLRGTSGGSERTLIVVEEFLGAVEALPSRPWLVLRLHPKNRAREAVHLGRYFHQMSGGDDPLPLLAVADLVVGMTSMLLVEAALLGRPTLSIVPRACEAHWLPTVGAGITPCAWTPDRVRELLVRQLRTPRLPRRDELERIFPSGATARVVACLEQAARMPPREE